MGFEIRDGREHLPDEEDIYGVNDADERDAFNALFGAPTQEDLLRRRRSRIRMVAFALAVIFIGLALFGLYMVIGGR